MAHTGIFCTKAEVDVKVGKNVYATGYTEDNINDSCAQAESVINCSCRYNFSDTYDSLNGDVKRILSEAAACWVAMDFIIHSMDSYTDRVEAEDMLNMLWAKWNFNIRLLRDQKVVDFINDA